MNKKQIYDIKVSGPCIETSCVFFGIKDIVNAEMWACKTTIIR